MLVKRGKQEKMSETSGSPAFLSPRSMSSRKSLYESPQARHKALREVLDRTYLLQENATVGSLDVLSEAVTEVDGIHQDIDDKIVNQDQILLDSQVMKVSSHVIRGAMDSLTQDTNSYNGIEFAETLLRYICNLADETSTEPNWDLLARDVAPLIKPCGYYQDFLHCMEPLPKAEVQPKRVVTRKKDALLPAKKPEKVITIENDDNPVDKTVDKIAHLIKKYYKHKKTKLNFFTLIVNPHDFGKTVENMLHVAFLVRDGRVALSVEDGDLFVQPIPTSVHTARKDAGDDERTANIPGLTMSIWKLMIESLDITEPMIDFE